MPISNIQKVIPLCSLSVIITCTTFSYVATASEGSAIFLSAHLTMQVQDPDWALPSWFKINKGGVAIRRSWYTLFEKKVSREGGRLFLTEE